MDNLKIKDGLCTYVWERLRVSNINYIISIIFNCGRHLAASEDVFCKQLYKTRVCFRLCLAITEKFKPYTLLVGLQE